MNPRRELTPAQIAWATQERLKNPPTPWCVLTADLHVGRRRLQSFLPPGLCQVIPRGKAFTPEQKADIIKAYETEEGITVRALAERYHCCHQRICELFRKAGVKSRRGGQSLGPNGKIVYPKSGASRPPFVEKPIGQAPEFSEIDQAILRARLEAGMIDGRRRPSSMPLVSCRSSMADL
jgi:hypothetical protein